MGDIYFFSMSFTPPGVILWCQNNVIKSPIFSDFSLCHPFWGPSQHLKSHRSCKLAILNFPLKMMNDHRLGLITMYSQRSQAHSRCSIKMFSEWMNEWMNGEPCLQRRKLVKLELRGGSTILCVYPSPDSPASPLIFSWFHEWLQSCVSSRLWHENPWDMVCCPAVRPDFSLLITPVTHEGGDDACVLCHPEVNCQGQVEYFHPAFLPFLFSLKLLLVIKAEANWNWQLCSLPATGNLLEIMWTTFIKT